jgi:hypothetical protein
MILVPRFSAGKIWLLFNMKMCVTIRVCGREPAHDTWRVAVNGSCIYRERPELGSIGLTATGIAQDQWHFVKPQTLYFDRIERQNYGPYHW